MSRFEIGKLKQLGEASLTRIISQNTESKKEEGRYRGGRRRSRSLAGREPYSDDGLDNHRQNSSELRWSNHRSLEKQARSYDGWPHTHSPPACVKSRASAVFCMQDEVMSAYICGKRWRHLIFTINHSVRPSIESSRYIDWSSDRVWIFLCHILHTGRFGLLRHFRFAECWS